jgi:hypothetical protein
MTQNLKNIKVNKGIGVLNATHVSAVHQQSILSLLSLFYEKVQLIIVIQGATIQKTFIFILATVRT